ncbi:hypothetical protein ACFSNO_03130 [Streptomyces cirratus]
MLAGLLAVAATAFLGAVFLTADARRFDAPRPRPLLPAEGMVQPRGHRGLARLSASPSPGTTRATSTTASPAASVWPWWSRPRSARWPPPDCCTAP